MPERVIGEAAIGMNESGRHRFVSEVFLRACELPPEKRRQFIQSRCADDHNACAELERMLAVDENAPKFLEPDAVAARAARIFSEHPAIDPSDSTIPEMIGRYRVLRRLGAGGMGVVYLVEQDSPRRVVALKAIRPDIATASMLAHFEREVQVLGSLQHPGIARIIEAGMIDGNFGPQPYFTMEYIDGKPLTEFLDASLLGITARISLLVEICDAVQHAHQKGVIHRDLKPDNILVQLDGQPKVLDFGIARATDANVNATTIYCAPGSLVGTLPYMSPEQLDGCPDGLDTRSDVYSLGVIGYRMLAGRPPYILDNTTIYEAIQIIKEVAPTPLGSSDRELRGDIANVIHKALEKDKGRRFQSASDLAADLGRVIRDEPVTARPATPVYHLRKFAKRNKALVVVTFLAVASMITGTVISVQQARSARAEARRAKQAEDMSEAAINFWTRVVSSGEPGNSRFDMPLRTALDRASDLLEDYFTDAPQEAYFRHELSKTLIRLTDFASAEKHLRRERDILDTISNPTDLRFIENSQLLAHVLIKQKRIEQAESLIAESLTYLREQLGGANINTLSMMLTDARALAGGGRLDAAFEMLGTIDDSVSRIRSRDHALALICKAEMAEILRAQRRFDEAISLQSEVLAARRRTLGPEHVDTATAINNLATMYMAAAKPDEAEVFLREALPIQRAIWGPEHIEPLRCQMSLVRVLKQQEDFSQAEPLCRDVLQKSMRAFGEGHFLVAHAKLFLADMSRLQGGCSEAIVLYDALIDRELRADREGDLLALSLTGRGVCLTQEGRFDEAQCDLVGAIAILHRLRKATPEIMCQMAAYWRDLYSAWGKRDEEADAAWNAQLGR